MWPKRYYLSVCIWFRECAHLGPESTVLLHPQLRLFTLQLFLNFRRNFSLDRPSFFWSSRFNHLTNSRYPPPWYQIVGASCTVSNREFRYPLPSVLISFKFGTNKNVLFQWLFPSCSYEIWPVQVCFWDSYLQQIRPRIIDPFKSIFSFGEKSQSI